MLAAARSASVLHAAGCSRQRWAVTRRCRTAAGAAAGGAAAVAAAAAARAAEVPAEADDWQQRSRLLLGPEGIDRLASTRVLLVGLGGVGSFTAEFLARAGVGSLTLCDGDCVDTTNRNRQLPALVSSIGRPKTEAVAARLRDINPSVQLTVHQEFLDPGRAAGLLAASGADFVVDAIDSVAPKVALLQAGAAAGVPTISSMGAGGRLDPSRARLADISDTYNDPFAAVVRRRLRKAGVAGGITVVFSDELPAPASLALTEAAYKRSYFGTSSYIPGLFGLLIASHIIRSVVQPGSYRLPRLPQAQAAAGKRQQRRPRGRAAAGVSPSDPAAASKLQRHTPDTAAPTSSSDRSGSSSGLLASYDQAAGVGLGLDGTGL